jgi:hypothetical protein
MSFDWDRPFTPLGRKTARLLLHCANGATSWVVYDEGLPSESIADVYTATGKCLPNGDERPLDLIQEPEMLGIKELFVNAYEDGNDVYHETLELAVRRRSPKCTATVKIPAGQYEVVARGPAWDRRGQ